MKKVASKFILNYFSNSDGVFKKIAQMFGSSENAFEELQEMAHGEVKERVSYRDLISCYPSLKKISHAFEVNEASCKLASLSQVYKVTDSEGKDLLRAVFPKAYDVDKNYISRLKRNWTLVALKGTVKMYRGQNIRSSWIKIRDLNDELEQRILL